MPHVDRAFGRRHLHRMRSHRFDTAFLRSFYELECDWVAESQSDPSVRSSEIALRATLRDRHLGRLVSTSPDILHRLNSCDRRKASAD
jgi:hypothetical protein